MSTSSTLNLLKGVAIGILISCLFIQLRNIHERRIVRSVVARDDLRTIPPGLIEYVQTRRGFTEITYLLYQSDLTPYKPKLLQLLRMHDSLQVIPRSCWISASFGSTPSIRYEALNIARSLFNEQAVLASGIVEYLPMETSEELLQQKIEFLCTAYNLEPSEIFAILETQGIEAVVDEFNKHPQVARYPMSRRPPDDDAGKTVP